MSVHNFVHRQWKGFVILKNELGFDTFALSAPAQLDAITADSQPRDAIHNVFCTFQHPRWWEKNHHVMLSSSFPRVSHPLHLEQRETIFGVLTVLLTFAKVTTEKVVWEGFSQDVFSYLIEILTVTFEMIKEYYSSWNRTERRIIAKPAGTVTGKLSWLTSSPQSCLYTWYRKSPLQWSHRAKITWRGHSVSSCLAHFSYMDVTSSHDASFSNCPQLHSSLFSFLRCSCTKWTVKNIGSRWQRHASRAFRAS